MNTANFSRAAVVALIVFAASAYAANRPLSERELVAKDGKPLSVLLVRIVTEVDGAQVEPFRHSASMDNVTFGIGGFETGMGVEEAVARFLSDDTRKEGWVYLLVRPGLHYLAVREPMSSNQFSYNARWNVCPRWRIEIPAESRVHYAGTLFLPGKGRWMISGPRQMVSFDVAHSEVRDESQRAMELSRRWLPDLGTPTVEIADLLEAGDTMIIETPEDKR